MFKKSYLKIDAHRNPIVQSEGGSSFKVTFEGQNSTGRQSKCHVSLNDFQIFTLLQRVTEIVKNRKSHQEWVLGKLKSSAE